jgi:hypothetical protein
MDVVTSDRLSRLVGAIYDCVIEPDRWPVAMEEICADLNCIMSALYLMDLERSQYRYVGRRTARHCARRARA